MLFWRIPYLTVSRATQAAGFVRAHVHIFYPPTHPLHMCVWWASRFARRHGAPQINFLYLPAAVIPTKLRFFPPRLQEKETGKIRTSGQNAKVGRERHENKSRRRHTRTDAARPQTLAKVHDAAVLRLRAEGLFQSVPHVARSHVAVFQEVHARKSPIRRHGRDYSRCLGSVWSRVWSLELRRLVVTL